MLTIPNGVSLLIEYKGMLLPARLIVTDGSVFVQSRLGPVSHTTPLSVMVRSLAQAEQGEQLLGQLRGLGYVNGRVEILEAV